MWPTRLVSSHKPPLTGDALGSSIENAEAELDPFGGPFNGQLGRIAIVSELLLAFPFKAIVETGSFTGSTTEYLLSETSLPVCSVEIDSVRASAVEKRLAKYGCRARIKCGDSRDFLTELAADPAFPKEHVFFYLDAHWNADLPLFEEIELIRTRWKNSIVMIDDFEVPGDADYGFDDYGSGRRLSIERLPPEVLQLPLFFPSLRGHTETGHRRGCVVVATDQSTGMILTRFKRLSSWRDDSDARSSDSPGTSSTAADQLSRNNLGLRFLLVKAHVGFGDRLQALSHAIEYATKYQRILSVDWSDSIWSDGDVNFDTYFTICGVPTIPPSDLYALGLSSISPQGWVNQLERRAHLRHLNGPAYANLLDQDDHEAQILVYGSVGYRKYYRDNLTLLRIRRQFRDKIVASLKEHAELPCVVHLRGTDRRGSMSHERYIEGVVNKIDAAGWTGPVLVVSDCLPLFNLFKALYPQATLRTPYLDRFNSVEGTHFQQVVSKHEYNLQLLIDFFLLIYARIPILDEDSIFSQMTSFLRSGAYQDILGHDG